MSGDKCEATAVLSAYAAGLNLERLPNDVQSMSRVILADTLGVLFGSSTRVGVRTAIAALGPTMSGPCTVVGHGRIASPETAALINGIGGHHIELDDMHTASRGHIAAVVVPAALAAAELVPAATLGELLGAITAAYDIQVRVAVAMDTEATYSRGFHPTTVVGSIGAAVSSGRILKLSAQEMQYCLGLAAAQCSGLLNFVDDPTHMQKSFQTGIAARNGLTAAILAKHAYRAAPQVLTTKFNMLNPFSGHVVPDRLVKDLGVRYEICQTTIKQHACCANTHSALDALLSIKREFNLSFDDIQKIDVQLAHSAVARVNHNPLWTHNIQYLMALAAHEGPVRLHHFNDNWTAHPEIRELSTQVNAVGSDELQSRFPDEFSAIVSVKTPDAVLSKEVRSPRGHFSDPLTEDELNDKFHSLAADILPRSEAVSLWRYVMSADLNNDLSSLFGVSTS